MSDSSVIEKDVLEDKRKASQLPLPCGWKILIALPEKEDKTEGGVYVPEELRDREHIASITGMVLRMGPDAYGDKEKFPSGPYCKVGDWVMIPAYSGRGFFVHKQEFKLINDDTVEAVVQDPRGVKRR